MVRLGSQLLGREEVLSPTSETPSPLLARRVEEKIIGLGQGQMDEATLSPLELDSWIRYGLQGYFPGFISDLSTAIEKDRVVLSGRVAMEQVPGAERLGFARVLFGDTAEVTVNGRVDGLAPGRGLFQVDEVYVGAVLLPSKLRDQLLAQVKGGSNPDLPVNAVGFDLPDFVTDVAVRGDSLVLRSSLESD